MHMNCHPGAHFCVLFIHVFIYLAALSLSCSMWDLLLWHVGSSSLRMNRIWALLLREHRVLASAPLGKSLFY